MLDRTLVSDINARYGAWESPISKDHIKQPLLKAEDKLRSGLSGDEVTEWKYLYKLQVGWD